MQRFRTIPAQCRQCPCAGAANHEVNVAPAVLTSTHIAGHRLQVRILHTRRCWQYLLSSHHHPDCTKQVPISSQAKQCNRGAAAKQGKSCVCPEYPLSTRHYPCARAGNQEQMVSLAVSTRPKLQATGTHVAPYYIADRTCLVPTSTQTAQSNHPLHHKIQAGQQACCFQARQAQRLHSACSVPASTLAVVQRIRNTWCHQQHPPVLTLQDTFQVHMLHHTSLLTVPAQCPSEP